MLFSSSLVLAAIGCCVVSGQQAIGDVFNPIEGVVTPIRESFKSDNAQEQQEALSSPLEEITNDVELVDPTESLTKFTETQQQEAIPVEIVAPGEADTNTDEGTCLLAVDATNCDEDENKCGNFNGHELSCETFPFETDEVSQCVCRNEKTCIDAFTLDRKAQFDECSQDSECQGHGRVDVAASKCQQKLFCAKRTSEVFSQCHTCDSCLADDSKFDCDAGCKAYGSTKNKKDVRDKLASKASVDEKKKNALLKSKKEGLAKTKGTSGTSGKVLPSTSDGQKIVALSWISGVLVLMTFAPGLLMHL